jgi:hypothetical protein
VLIAQQQQQIGQQDHLVEELATELRVKQAVAEARVEVECLAEGTLAADRNKLISRLALSSRSDELQRVGVGVPVADLAFRVALS